MSHKEVTAVIGEYTNSKGEVKKRYMKIGAIIESKHGSMLKLDSVPLEWNGYAYINEPYDADKPKQSRQDTERRGIDDTDVPF
jgi:hypothetical protein